MKFSKKFLVKKVLKIPYNFRLVVGRACSTLFLIFSRWQNATPRSKASRMSTTRERISSGLNSNPTLTNFSTMKWKFWVIISHKERPIVWVRWIARIGGIYSLRWTRRKQPPPIATIHWRSRFVLRLLDIRSWREWEASSLSNSHFHKLSVMMIVSRDHTNSSNLQVWKFVSWRRCSPILKSFFCC